MPAALAQRLAAGATDPSAPRSREWMLPESWRVLAAAIGPDAAARLLTQRPGAARIVHQTPATLSAKLANLASLFQLAPPALGAALERSPALLDPSPDAIAPRIRNLAVLFGMTPHDTAYFVLAKPAWLQRDVPFPEQRLADLQAVLGLPVEDVRACLGTCHTLLTLDTADIAARLASLAAGLAVDLPQAQDLARRCPSLLSYSGERLAATVQQLPAQLGMTGEQLRAAALENPMLLTSSPTAVAPRLRQLEAWAARSPNWGAQWAGMPVNTRSRMLQAADKQHARLRVLLDHGLDQDIGAPPARRLHRCGHALLLDHGLHEGMGAPARLLQRRCHKTACAGHVSLLPQAPPPMRACALCAGFSSALLWSKARIQEKLTRLRGAADGVALTAAMFAAVDAAAKQTQLAAAGSGRSRKSKQDA